MSQSRLYAMCLFTCKSLDWWTFTEIPVGVCVRTQQLTALLTLWPPGPQPVVSFSVSSEAGRVNFEKARSRANDRNILKNREMGLIEALVGTDMSHNLMDPDPTTDEGRPYDFVKLLGKGAFGKVYHCINLETREECAVKILSKNTLHSEIDNIRNEVRILSSLDHQNIVKFRTLRQSRKHIYVEMELLSGGTLKSMMATRTFSDEEAATIMKGILKAVVYLHKKGIIHRDLKPANILFGSTTNLADVKVTDFGLSAKFERGNYYQKLYENCGTMSFMAPEQAEQRRYSRPVDIWSCGIILHMVATNKHPLLSPHDSQDTYLAKLSNPVWHISSRLSPLAKDLFERMVEFTPLKRYTAEQALSHPWITRENNEIPMTYIERLQAYNDKSKLVRMCLKTVAMAVLVRGSEFPKGVYERYIEEVYNPPVAQIPVMIITEAPLRPPTPDNEKKFRETMPRLLSPQKGKDKKRSNSRVEALPSPGKRMSLCMSPVPGGKPNTRKVITARFGK